MRITKKIICETVSLIIVFTSFLNIQTQEFQATTNNNTAEIGTSINELLDVDKFLFLDTDKPYIDASVSYLINADTGQVLYNDDGDYPMDVLSISKTLSAYVILDEMKKNPEKYNWETKIKAEGNIVLISYESNFSNLALYEDSEYTLRELFEGMMIKSSNSATMLIGKYMFGGEKQFVDVIRKKATDLNLKHTEMYTSTGLNKNDLLEYGYDDLEDGNNRMTAEDVAFLTKKIIEDYPIILEITSKSTSVFGTLTDAPFEYGATNWLLPGFKYGYDGVTGLKTGADLMEYTSNVVFTAEKNGVKLIGVILGARDSDIRSEGAIQLLDYGFNLLVHKTLISKESKLFGNGTVKMKFADKKTLAVTVANDFVISTSHEDLHPNYIFVPTNTKYNKDYNAFEGEIKAGEVLGYITVTFSDLSFLTDKNTEHYSVDVIAAEDIGHGFFVFNGFEWVLDSLKRSFA